MNVSIINLNPLQLFYIVDNVLHERAGCAIDLLHVLVIHSVEFLIALDCVGDEMGVMGRR